MEHRAALIIRLSSDYHPSPDRWSTALLAARDRLHLDALPPGLEEALNDECARRGIDMPTTQARAAAAAAVLVLVVVVVVLRATPL